MLAFSRNGIQQDYCSKELAREDWNKDYVDYLQSQFIRDEFEKQQAVELYREKAARAGEPWNEVLKEISSATHKCDYMDYLEGIKYKDTADVTLKDAKEEILSYEEFAGLKKVAEEEKRVRDSEMGLKNVRYFYRFLRCILSAYGLYRRKDEEHQV